MSIFSRGPKTRWQTAILVFLFGPMALVKRNFCPQCWHPMVWDEERDNWRCDCQEVADD